MADTKTDGRRARGERSREAILERAVALASVHGLDGLTLGRLAEAAGVSKSGFFAHWRDKEQLQLDAVDWAGRQWTEWIVKPALREPPGVRRLVALHEARLAFYAASVLPGGCFFFVAQVEFDDHPGPVRDRIAKAVSDWLGFIERQVAEAVALGELPPGTDAAQLAYEIDALGEAAVIHTRLLGHDLAYTRARRAVLQRLRALAIDPSLLPEDPA
ncbi:TetR/AcrR family transcriptional regulator [Nonomuraea muscovyensis]|jgi:AcrR family transcriptional regulator|uniref:AcrR family transcriptional regulator n=1 Tax=Nonomuraea muscovyensis TaxID=1124761 RepID=A0A7X0EVV4_9ACTN|nr:TetR/AcrR family transcriptional regulator [Nonomuraea muscovyensis]MBB6343639.1 AcrR family transcriptional regulator [Nonomuraea muscovyensis]MDF2707077.1 putative transcriptional regulator, TetR family [Nonomuraea muscovyensis]